jgi:hypothetical protein
VITVGVRICERCKCAIMAHNGGVMKARKDEGVTRGATTGLSTALLDLPFVAYTVNEGAELDTIMFTLDGNIDGVSVGKFDIDTDT